MAPRSNCSHSRRVLVRLRSCKKIRRHGIRLQQVPGAPSSSGHRNVNPVNCNSDNRARLYVPARCGLSRNPLQDNCRRHYLVAPFRAAKLHATRGRQ